MTYNDALALIQAEIVANGNNEITANVLRPVLEAMVDFPNDVIGVLADLDTSDTTTIVNAINSIVGQNLPNATALRAIDTTGIDFNQDELLWVRDAINQTATNNGAFTCNLGEQMVFFCDVLIDIVGTEANVQRRYYRLTSGATLVNSLGTTLTPPLMPDGSSINTIELTGDLVIDLGNIGSDSIEVAFNSHANQPFTISGDTFVQAVQNGENKLWQWIGGDGTFGNSATLATSTYFVDLTDSGVPSVNALSETSNKVITLSLQDIGATDFDDDVKTKMLAYLQSEGVIIEAGVMPVIELNDKTYNFQIEADWTANSVTDEASFVTFMNGKQDGSGVTVTDFILDGDWIRCNLSNSDASELILDSSNIKKVISIGEWIGLIELILYENQLTEFNPSIALPSSLTYLNLYNNQLTEFNPSIALPSSLTFLNLQINQLTEFNPSIALPSSLTRLYLNTNQLTTTSYTNAETWATLQPSFTNTCQINLTNNTDSITGTNLENILLTKNVTITA